MQMKLEKKQMIGIFQKKERNRIRQAKRMADFAKKLKDDGNYVIADFVCPTPEARNHVYFQQIICSLGKYNKRGTF